MPPNRVERVVSEITDLAFQRSSDGEGLLILTLTNSKVDASIFSEGGDITLQFLNTNIRESLIRRFDVTDFATPLRALRSVPQIVAPSSSCGRMGCMTISPTKPAMSTSLRSQH